MTITATYEMTQSVDQRVGEQVRFWMFRRAVRQPELAEKLGVTAASASRKIAGKIGWSVSDLAKAAAVLDVPLSELMPDDTIEIARAEMESQSVPCVGLEPTTKGLECCFWALQSRFYAPRAVLAWTNFRFALKRRISSRFTRGNWPHEQFHTLACPSGMARPTE